MVLILHSNALKRHEEMVLRVLPPVQAPGVEASGAFYWACRGSCYSS
jgi:hypothetical protein